MGNPKVSSQAKTLSWALVYDVLSQFQSIWKKSIDGPLRKLSLKVEIFTSTSFISMRYVVINQLFDIRDSF